MGYIKIKLRSRTSDEHGNTHRVRIEQIESDMGGVDTNTMLLAVHALAASGGRVEMEDNCFDYTLDLVLD